MDVPSSMLSVCAAAAPRMVSPSSPTPPVVSQTADTPRLSALLMRARIVPASGSGDGYSKPLLNHGLGPLSVPRA